jgi:hypothetical protein
MAHSGLRMHRPLLLHWAYVAGLVGGILILVGTGLFALFLVLMRTVDMFDWAHDWAGMPALGAMRAAWLGMLLLVLAWGAAAGALTLWAVSHVRRGRGNLVGKGVVLIVAGAVSLAVGGGFWLGALATITSGVLVVVAERPSASGAAPPAPPPS